MAIFGYPLDFFQLFGYTFQYQAIQSFVPCFLLFVSPWADRPAGRLICYCMGLPSKKRTPRSKRDRNSHAALKSVNTIKCEACGTQTLPHRACMACGSYKGRKAVNTEKRVERRTKRVKRLSK